MKAGGQGFAIYKNETFDFWLMAVGLAIVVESPQPALPIALARTWNGKRDRL